VTGLPESETTRAGKIITSFYHVRCLPVDREPSMRDPASLLLGLSLNANTLLQLRFPRFFSVVQKAVDELS